LKIWKIGSPSVLDNTRFSQFSIFRGFFRNKMRFT
jgi:hypothetical protein